MAKKGGKISAEHKRKISEATQKRWDKIKADRAAAPDPITPAEKTTVSGIVAKPMTNGIPLARKMELVEIDDLPTRYNTAEQHRAYILQETDQGRQIVDTFLGNMRNRKATHKEKRESAKELLAMIVPEKGQKMEFGFESPDGQFAFRWQGETLDDA